MIIIFDENIIELKIFSFILMNQINSQFQKSSCFPTLIYMK